MATTKKATAKARKPAPKVTAAKAPKAKARAKAAKAKPAPKAAQRKPGVIATIVECLRKGPVTKGEIHAVLVKRFPDRDEDGMLATINVQVPGRIAREQDITVTRDGDKYSAK